MKTRIFLFIIAGILLTDGGCDKIENDYMNQIPAEYQLLRQVNTYYNDYVVVDTFYYNSNYELSCFERREDSSVNRFYFEGKKLKEQKVTVKENGKDISYYINYLNDGTLTVTNNTTAYLLSEQDSGYYTHLTCFTRKPFEDWVENYQCNFNWDKGNLNSTCYKTEMVNYNYDNNPNPLAGYVFWGFFYDEFLTGTTNNRMEYGYQYQYNDEGYPVRLETPKFYREYYYYN
jgi:hypothetical protein